MPKPRPQTSNVWAQTMQNWLIGFNQNLDYDQLILEFYTPGEPNSGWIHCSYTSDQPRKQFLHAYKSEGKTKYKPVIGKAKDLVIRKINEKDTGGKHFT